MSADHAPDTRPEAAAPPAAESADFQVIPAIDLMDGGCVRLEQGDAKRRTRYDAAPGDVAAAYAEAGARRLHVVDLDGAFAGVARNMAALKDIVAATARGMTIEVGGGVRDEATVEALLGAGVDHVVIGTKALEDQDFLGAMVALHGDRIIVGADCREGKISTRGWTSDSAVFAVPFLRRLRREIGIATAIYTDIARDGMFTGTNMEELAEVLGIQGLQVIASGGVGSLDDIRALKALAAPNLRGVIVGKALYDGRLDLREALAAAAEPAPPAVA